MIIRLAVLFFLLLSSGKINSQNDSILKNYRVINLSKNKIALTGNIDSIKNIVVKDGKNNYHLKKEVFDVADSIGLEVNDQKQIISITFRYDYEPEFSNDTAYIHELHKFQKFIGSLGKEYKQTFKNKSVKVNKWEDKKTTFELVEVVKNGRKQKVYSTLYDIKLMEANSEIIAERKKKNWPFTIIKEL